MQLTGIPKTVMAIMALMAVGAFALPLDSGNIPEEECLSYSRYFCDGAHEKATKQDEAPAKAARAPVEPVPDIVQDECLGYESYFCTGGGGGGGGGGGIVAERAEAPVAEVASVAEPVPEPPKEDIVQDECFGYESYFCKGGSGGGRGRDAEAKRAEAFTA